VLVLLLSPLQAMLKLEVLGAHQEQLLHCLGSVLPLVS
jgi:hypothetical protein